jgi:hypothetical protein
MRLVDDTLVVEYVQYVPGNEYQSPTTIAVW